MHVSVRMLSLCSIVARHRSTNLGSERQGKREVQRR